MSLDTFDTLEPQNSRERSLARVKNDPPREVHRKPRHGTPSGYSAHMKAGEAPCQGCRTAHTLKRVRAGR